MKKYWISWYQNDKLGVYELHTPWWVTAEVMDTDNSTTICAAVYAASEKIAKEMIYSAYDNRPPEIEFRFCRERKTNWSPFCAIFPRADWMLW